MVFKNFIIAFILVGALLLPYNVGAKDKEDYKIYHMPSYKISKYIKSTAGQRRAIMIYASWCPHCVKKLPKMMDVEKVKQGSIIAISVDEQHSDFVRYLKKFKDIPFKIILNKDSEYKLAQNLKKFGIKAWDGIPYIILMDEKNKVVGQGNYSVDKVADYVLAD